MAIKDIIARGIGFSPGSIKFIVTHGFSSAAVDLTDPDEIFQTRRIIGKTLGPKSDIKIISKSSGNR